MRRDDRAAVRDRRVDDRELERRDLHVALADGEVLVVADRPRPVGAVGDPAAAGRMLRLALERAGARCRTRPRAGCAARATRRRGAFPGLSSGRSIPVFCPIPYRCAQCWSAPPFGARRVGQHAEVVEEVVRGDLDRVDEVERAVDGVAGVVPALAAEAELAGVVERLADAPGPALERRGGGDRLERRAGRARALVRAVDLRVARVGAEQRVVRRRTAPAW